MIDDEDENEKPKILEIDDERSEEWKEWYKNGYALAFSATWLYPRRKDERRVEWVRFGDRDYRLEDFIDAMAVIYANNKLLQKEKEENEHDEQGADENHGSRD